MPCRGFAEVSARDYADSRWQRDLVFKEDQIARDSIWSLTNEARAAGADDLVQRDELQELIARGFE